MAKCVFLCDEALERIKALLRSDISHKVYELEHATDKQCIKTVACSLTSSLIAMEELEK